MGVRSAIDIDHGGILLGRVEAYGLDETVIEVCLPVGSLDGPAARITEMNTLDGIIRWLSRLDLFIIL